MRTNINKKGKCRLSDKQLRQRWKTLLKKIAQCIFNSKVDVDHINRLKNRYDRLNDCYWIDL